MKIFFNASIAGRDEYLNEYTIIVKALKQLGHTVFASHVLEGELDLTPNKLRKDYTHHSKKIKGLLFRSDLMIVESSFPSMSVGYLLNLALQQRKFVLVLYKSNAHSILVGETNRYLVLRKYDPKNFSKLKEILAKFILESKRLSLKIRFNLMIDEELDKILEIKSSRYKVSKADYIRKLIERDADDLLTNLMHS